MKPPIVPQRPYSDPDQVPRFCLSINVWGFFTDSISALLCSKPAWLLLVSPLHPFGGLGKLSFLISEDKKKKYGSSQGQVFSGGARKAMFRCYQEDNAESRGPEVLSAERHKACVVVH